MNNENQQNNRFGGASKWLDILGIATNPVIGGASYLFRNALRRLPQGGGTYNAPTSGTQTGNPAASNPSLFRNNAPTPPSGGGNGGGAPAQDDGPADESDLAYTVNKISSMYKGKSAADIMAYRHQLMDEKARSFAYQEENPYATDEEIPFNANQLDQMNDPKVAALNNELDYVDSAIADAAEKDTGSGGGGKGVAVDAANSDYGVSSEDSIDQFGVDINQLSELASSVVRGYGNLKDLTPTQRGEILKEFARVGYDPKRQLIGKLEGLLELWQKIPKIKKGAGVLLSPFATATDPNAKAFNSAKTILTRQVARLYDVGMLSDQDVASYKKALPDRADWSYNVAKASIEGLAKGQGIDLGSDFGAPKESDSVRVMSPDGQSGTIPRSQLRDALAEGYKQI